MVKNFSKILAIFKVFAIFIITNSHPIRSSSTPTSSYSSSSYSPSYSEHDFKSKFNRAYNQLSTLDSKLSKLRSLAVKIDHKDVEEVCKEAKQSLSRIKSSLKKFSKKNLLRSKNSYYSSSGPGTYSESVGGVEDHEFSKESGGGHVNDGDDYGFGELDSSLEDFNQILNSKILNLRNVEINKDYYKSSIKECQNYFKICKDSFDSFWNPKKGNDSYNHHPSHNYPPNPIPSPIYNKDKLYKPSSTDSDPKTSSLNRRGSLHGDKENQLSSCSEGETLCPILEGSSGFECLDTNLELSSCGGCTSLGEGQNCLEIEGASGIACMSGKCVVLSVQRGFYLKYNGLKSGRPIIKKRR